MNRPSFLLLLGLVCVCHCSTVIPSSLVKGLKDGQLSYGIHLSIGTPPMKVVLEASFETNDIILYRDVQRMSLSYSNQNGYESDIVYVSDIQYRMNIITDPRKYYGLSKIANCSECDGIIGLKRDSVFWKLSPDATFTSVSVTTGSVNPVIIGPVGCNGALVWCDPYEDDSLCTTFGMVNQKNYTVKFSIQSPFTYLPISLYDQFVQGNNVYKSSDSSWKPMNIDITQKASVSLEEHTKISLKSKMVNIENCREDIKITLDPKYMIGKSETGMKVLLIKPNQDTEDNTIIIGSSCWNQFIFYVNTEDNVMIVHNHTVHPNMSITNLFLYSVMLWLLIRWKMTDVSIVVNNANRSTTPSTNDLSNINPSKRGVKGSNVFSSTINNEGNSFTRKESIMNLFYEVVAIPLVGVAFLLNTTSSIMKDFPTVYWISGISFLVSVAVEVWSIVILISNARDTRKDKKMSLSFATHLNITRNITHETNLVTGMWLCLVERRTEGISTILTVAANAYGVYNLTFHIVVLIIFYIHTKPAFGNRNGVIWIFTTIGVPMFYGYYVYASYWYFAYPLMKRNARLYSQLVVPTLILGYFMIVNVAVYIASLYIKKGLLKVLSHHNPLDITMQQKGSLYATTATKTGTMTNSKNIGSRMGLVDITYLIFGPSLTNT